MIDRSEEPIWTPSKQKINSSNIKNFSKYLSKCDLGDYNDYPTFLHEAVVLFYYNTLSHLRTPEVLV